MRKASFIWPWEKSVKKILITSLQNTTVFVWNRTIWGCSMTIHSLFQWEGKSGSKMVGLMPSIVINAFIKMRFIKSRPIGGRYGRVCNLYVCPLCLASLINQSVNRIFFTSFKNKIHSPWYQIREQAFGNQVIVFTPDVNMGSGDEVAKCD